VATLSAEVSQAWFLPRRDSRTAIRLAATRPRRPNGGMLALPCWTSLGTTQLHIVRGMRPRTAANIAFRPEGNGKQREGSTVASSGGGTDLTRACAICATPLYKVPDGCRLTSFHQLSRFTGHAGWRGKHAGLDVISKNRPFAPSPRASARFRQTASALPPARNNAIPLHAKVVWIDKSAVR
jgi:hypothetical protein